MKNVYIIDLINSYFSKEEAAELILSLISYKIDFHTNKLFSTEVKFGIEDKESKYRLDKLCASRDSLIAFLKDSDDTHFKLTAELKIEPKVRD